MFEPHFLFFFNPDSLILPIRILGHIEHPKLNRDAISHIHLTYELLLQQKHHLLSKLKATTINDWWRFDQTRIPFFDQGSDSKLKKKKYFLIEMLIGTRKQQGEFMRWKR